jgi:uncharacterized membrane protein
MSSEFNWRLLLPARVRTLDADFAAIFVWVLATNAAVFTPVVSETPLRILLGLPFVLFVPGYALIAALFPEAPTKSFDKGDSDEGTRQDVHVDGIDGIERVALSFGTSIAVVPLLGLILNFTPFGIRLAPIMVFTSAITLVLTILAIERRRDLPEEDRFSVPYDSWLASVKGEFLRPDSRADVVLNVVLVVSLLLAVSSVGYAVAVPQQGESFTELYLLTEDDGELVADGYPTEFTRGESKPLTVGIGNQEHESINYSVVVQLQRVKTANNSTKVLEERKLSQFSTRLEHNETWHTNQSLTPTLSGEKLRVAYLLYKGEPPANPTTESAYREVHLWINVSSGS